MRSGSRSRRGGSEVIAGLLLFTILSIATFSAYLIAVERLRGWLASRSPCLGCTER